MVPAEGFEPPTFGLQNRCTTTVLSRPRAPPFASDDAERPAFALRDGRCQPRRVEGGGVGEVGAHPGGGVTGAPGHNAARVRAAAALAMQALDRVCPIEVR